MRKKFFAILAILILGFLFYQAKEILTSSLWDGKSRISFVFVSKTSVASLEPGKSLTLLELPENLYLEVPGGFGKYQLGSVYELGKLEARGEELVKVTWQNYLGIPIDGYMKMSNVKCQMSNVSKCIFNCLTGRGETNFNRWDLARLWWEIKKLRSDKIKFINLDETNILREESLPDGSKVFVTELFRLDELVKKFFSDSKIEKEGIKIEILNATEQRGLANKAARLIRNMGGNIIGIGNTELRMQDSKLKAQKKEILKTYTVRKLEKILKVKAEVGDLGESRADLLILIGEDY